MTVDLNDGHHLLIEVRARSYPCDSVIDQALPTVGDGRRRDTQNFAYLGPAGTRVDLQDVDESSVKLFVHVAPSPTLGRSLKVSHFNWK